ncbi:hypothetical protein ACQR1W_35495 [Bradyrhizobium sp. HKCCYLS1011]|uniref:hypothetical protein n=1 Tax=Bradyrhizobium sp. HKCCYLS1011 TaxID=3420733 RepID=UPI003EBE707A
MLLAGLFAKPDRFGSIVERLNEAGLLSAEDDCKTLFQTYVALSEIDVVEPLAANATPTNVRIFAV